MLTLHDAYDIINQVNFRMPVVETQINNSLLKVLSEDIYSDIDLPPFDKSAVDGYALKKENLTKLLPVTGTIYAGSGFIPELKEGTCMKIMTGAPVPKGADIVVMQEDIRELPDQKIQVETPQKKANICFTGEDVNHGDLILKKGTLLQPHHIAVLASAGIVNPKVYAFPRIALLSTGSEIVEPDSRPDVSQIRNSNSYNLIAQMQNMNISPSYLGIVNDDENEIRDKINTALNENDILIMTGGVSIGEKDLIPAILEELNLDIKFQKLAIQPGKPVSFAYHNNKFCFGLSGNPVSSFLQFEILVKPLVYKLMNHEFQPSVVYVETAHEFKRNNAERLKFIPIQFDRSGAVTEIQFNGSAHIAGLTNADGFALFPKDCDLLLRGEKIEVLLI